MFYKRDESNYKQALDGVKFKSLVNGEKTSLHEFRLTKGFKIPIHSHPHEQTGYLVSGSLKFYLPEEELITTAGDSWNIPGNVEHGVDILEDSVVIEVFSPVREDYL